MTCVAAAAGGAARSTSAAGTPDQVMPRTENLVTQWKSATTSWQGSDLNPSEVHRWSAPEAVAPVTARPQAIASYPGTGP